MNFKRFFKPLQNQREREVAKLLSTSFEFSFRNIHFYIIALRHKSAARNLYEKPEVSNERLEFLGDAILDAIVADYLYATYPQAEEGELTKMKSRIVSRANLNRMAHEMNIQEAIETDAQALQALGSLAGNALEALFGAIYLDLNYLTARKIILNTLEKYGNIDHIDEKEVDFKSRLYEEAHRVKADIRFNTHLLKEANGEKTFTSKVVFDGKSVGKGIGTTKKKAEQMASKKGLETLAAISN